MSKADSEQLEDEITEAVLAVIQYMHVGIVFNLVQSHLPSALLCVMHVTSCPGSSGPEARAHRTRSRHRQHSHLVAFTCSKYMSEQTFVR